MAPYEDRPSSPEGKAKAGDYSPLTSSNDFHDENEKLLHSSRITQRTSKWTQVWEWLRLILETVGLLLLIANFVLLLHSSQPVTGPDPRVSSGPANKHMMYGSDPRYMSFNHKYDYLWNDAFTESWGAIALPPFKDAAGLYSKDPAHDEGGIGMFHAFHCLASMRAAFQKMNESTVTLEQLQKGDHVAHCFDYLRNVVLCMADGKCTPFRILRARRLKSEIQTLSRSQGIGQDILGAPSSRGSGTCGPAGIIRSFRRLWIGMGSGGGRISWCTMMRLVCRMTIRRRLERVPVMSGFPVVYRSFKAFGILLPL